VFDATTAHETLVVKMRIPTTNYFSSDNEEPVVAFLSTVDQEIYEFVHDHKIQLLTNDQLKSIEFILEDNKGTTIVLTADDSMEVMLKLDYVDQKEQVVGQLHTVPHRL
jgi:proteasome lid subunit RPN8/RPN11